MVDRFFLKESGFVVIVLLQFGNRGDMPRDSFVGYRDYKGEDIFAKLGVTQLPVRYKADWPNRLAQRGGCNSSVPSRVCSGRSRYPFR